MVTTSLGEEEAQHGDYIEPLYGAAAGVVGCLDGVCSVYADEPLPLNNGRYTNFAPALKLQVLDIELDDIDLGVAQLHSSVAVPLVGYQPSLFRVEGVRLVWP